MEGGLCPAVGFLTAHNNNKKIGTCTWTSRTRQVFIGMYTAYVKYQSI